MAKRILTDYDFSGNQILKLRVENLAAFPTPSSPGRLIYNTTTQKVGLDIGDNYLILGEGDGGGGFIVTEDGINVFGNGSTQIPTMVDFTGPSVSVTDDGDGTLTVQIDGGVTVSKDGVAVLNDAVTDINYVGFTVEDDGDGTVTVGLEAIGTGPVVRSRRPIVTKSANTTLLAAEEGYAIHMDSSTDITMTIPANSSAAIPIGAEFEVVRMNNGAVNITADTGVTLNGVEAGTTNVALQYASGILRKIAVNAWLVMGSVAAVVAAEEVTTYLWNDIFTDHRATAVYEDNEAGLDWTGFGTTENQPMDQALEWFMRNVVANESPNGSILDLNSPTGEAWFRGRVQVPPRTVAKNITIDFTGQDVLRGYDSDESRWGLWYLWGEKVNDPALASDAVVDADSSAGDYSVVLRDDEDTTAIMNNAVYGSIVEIRTDKTSFNYHPASSRATMFVASTDPATRTLTFIDPLPINVPRDNPVGSSFESSDPSTVTLLQGALLSSNASAGSNTIALASVLGFSVGDWLLVKTEEFSGQYNHQWSDGTEPNFESDLPDYNVSVDSGTDVPINEEVHQIVAISGNIITLGSSLGKNKLVSWQASATKVDPIDGLVIRGGNIFGGRTGSDSAWDHQYIWSRYMVNSSIIDVTFDGRNKAQDLTILDNYRRAGQAIRFDSGDNNMADSCWVGHPQLINAGEGYGISFRLGCRNTTVQNSYLEGCRHSIEWWASSGGCRAYNNHCHDTTSSAIDTHGNWNTGIIIEENLLSRDNATSASSPDLDGDPPDAIRLGNNKFVFDEDITVINNRVINFDGHAFSIVPGVHNVLVDGLTIENVYRALYMHENARNSNVPTHNVVIRNVTVDGWKDLMIDFWRESGVMIYKNFLLENWTCGATEGAQVGESINADGDIDCIRIMGVEDLTMRNFHVPGLATSTDPTENGRPAIWMRHLDGVTFDNVSFSNFERGIYIEDDITDVSGTITMNGIPADKKLLWRQSGTRTGSLTVRHQGTIVPPYGTPHVEDDTPGDALTITYEEII